MNKYNFTLTIEARTETDAEAKVKALTTLAGKLSVAELERLAYVVAHDKVKTALAKKYLGL